MNIKEQVGTTTKTFVFRSVLFYSNFETYVFQIYSVKQVCTSSHPNDPQLLLSVNINTNSDVIVTALRNTTVRFWVFESRNNILIILSFTYLYIIIHLQKLNAPYRADGQIYFRQDRWKMHVRNGLPTCRRGRRETSIWAVFPEIYERRCLDRMHTSCCTDAMLWQCVKYSARYNPSPQIRR